MTEQEDKADPQTDPEDTTDQNETTPRQEEPEPDPVDPREEVRKAVRSGKERSQKTQQDTSADPLEDLKLSDEQREAIESLLESRTSQAVNEAIETKKKRGDFMTKRQVENLVQKQREEWDKELEIEHNVNSWLNKAGVEVGSDEYQKFWQTFKDFQPTVLGSEEGVQKVMRAAGILKEESKSSAPHTSAGLPGVKNHPGFDAQHGRLVVKGGEYKAEGDNTAEGLARRIASEHGV